MKKYVLMVTPVTVECEDSEIAGICEDLEGVIKRHLNALGVPHSAVEIEEREKNA